MVVAAATASGDAPRSASQHGALLSSGGRGGGADDANALSYEHNVGPGAADTPNAASGGGVDGAIDLVFITFYFQAQINSLPNKLIYFNIGNQNYTETNIFIEN